MAARSPKEMVKVIQMVDPESNALGVDIATLDTPVDTFGFRYAMVIANIGASAGTWAIQVESSAATGGTYADITGALLSVGLTSDDTKLFGVIDLQGSTAGVNRWLQLTGTSATGTILLSVSVVLFGPHDTEQDLDWSVGGGDELDFEV